MVSTLNPGKTVGIKAVKAVTMMMDMSAPGRRRDISGVTTIIDRVTIPTARVIQSILPRLERYMAHFGKNSPGMFLRPNPRKSLICVEKMVRAIPAVNPTTIG